MKPAEVRVEEIRGGHSLFLSVPGRVVEFVRSAGEVVYCGE